MRKLGKDHHRRLDRRCFLIVAVAGFFAAGPLAADMGAPMSLVATSVAPPHVTPLDAVLPEDAITTIQVSWPENSMAPEPYADFPVAAGNYSYKVYLPPGYHAHPDWFYPALFVMYPDGNASIGNFQERARHEGWVVVMFVEAKNGAWGPIFGDMLATHADVIKRVRIQEGLKFGTGFSGGCRATSLLTQCCPGFAGELLQGAGFANDAHGNYHLENIPRDAPYAVYMEVGAADDNAKEIEQMMEELPPRVFFKSVTLEGRSRPCPANVLDDGLDWLLKEILARDNLSDNLKAFALRHFDYVAASFPNEPPGQEKTERLQELLDLADKLSIDQDMTRGFQYRSLKEMLAQSKNSP